MLLLSTNFFGDNKIDKFELAKVGQATEHNYCGVNCGIMDQFASVFGKEGSLIRLDCRSLEYQYFPFKPEGYRLVLVDSVVKHELASSAYNKRRQSCEAAVAAIQKKHPHVEFLRDCTMGMLQEAKAEISEEDICVQNTSLKKSNVYLMFAMLWKEVITKP